MQLAPDQPSAVYWRNPSEDPYAQSPFDRFPDLCHRIWRPRARVASPLLGFTRTPESATSTAEYVVVMPEPASCYNGDMILFAHGYVAPAISGRNLAKPALPARRHQPPRFVEQPGIRLCRVELFQGRAGDYSGHPGHQGTRQQ